MTKKSDTPISGTFTNKDIISLDQFDANTLLKLFSYVPEMADISKNAKPSDLLKGKIITLLFYEPSSRTFGSFTSAIKQLGGQTIDVLNPQQFSSVSKGETLSDTIRVFEAYCDLIVMRHPEMGAAREAAKAAEFVPIVNAGDGIGEHPTQAILDLYTIYEKVGRLDSLTGVLAGDILNGRTIHSLIKGLSLFKNNTFYLLSPDELALSQGDKDEFTSRGVKLVPISDERDIPNDADFWYWTRVQKERFNDPSEYARVKNKFILDKRLAEEYAGEKTIFLHPLPRVGEITEEMDTDPRSEYLRSQIRNGVYTRMALIALVLGAI